MAYPAFTAEPDTDLMRFRYTSLTTPSSVYEFNMKTRERRLLKRQEVLGGYNPEAYATERLMAPAYDGTLVPISLVYRKDTPKSAATPLLLYGYGSYGASTDPAFSPIAPQPARPRLRLRHRPRPRRPGDGPLLVRRRQAVQEDEHLHRFHLLRRVPGAPRLHVAGEALRLGRQRRRPADGRRRQPAARPVPRRSSPPCPSSTWSPPCSTPPSR